MVSPFQFNLKETTRSCWSNVEGTAEENVELEELEVLYQMLMGRALDPREDFAQMSKRSCKE